MEQKASSTNIKVAVRIRPLLTSEKAEKLRIQWSTQNNAIYQVDDNGQKYGELYSFDHIFGVDRTNVDIYNDVVKDFVMASLDGLNSTIFAYGQTSSGKTYTMLGNRADTGIMSLAIENIFDIIENNITRKFLIRVSYIEIYNEKINDLLDLDNKDVKIREVYPATIVLQNIKEEIISTREQMYECLKRGTENKKIGMTKANDKSSRSHTIFKIVIESTQANDMDGGSGGVQVSNLNLVDLAGSERVAQTKATGMRLKEGGHINKSLSALGLVIKQLSDGQDFVNFRDSKLTRLLQDSLGGNSKTLIIATITLVSIEDTASTLAFAQRAKTVKNKPRVNEILSDADVNKRYAALNAQLQMKLEEQKLINQKLQVTQQENDKEMKKLQQQMEMLEDFQYGKRTAEFKGIPKRRHTIGFTPQKRLLLRLLPEETEKSNCVSDNRTNIENCAGGTSHGLTRLETITEESGPESINITTPENTLKIRFTALEQEYNELVTFTRDEDNILSETSKKVEELEEQLEVAKLKILEFQTQQKLEKDFENQFKIRERELCDKIFELEEQLKIKEENSGFSSEDISEISYMMKQLMHLQDILSSSQPNKDSVDISCTNLKEENQRLVDKNLVFAKQVENLRRDTEFFAKEIENLNQGVKAKTDENLFLFEEVSKLQTIVNSQTVELDKLMFQIEDKSKTLLSITHENELLKKEIELVQNEKELRFRQQEELLTKEIEQLCASNRLLNTELNKIKLKLDDLNVEVREKNKVVYEINEKCEVLTEERNNLRKELSKTNAERLCLSEKIKELDTIRSSQAEELNQLKSEMVNKHTLLEEYQTNCRELECEKKNFEQKLARANADLQISDQKNESLSLEIEKLKVMVNDFTQKGIAKDSLIQDFENKCLTLKEERDQLKKELIDIITDKDLLSENQVELETTMTSHKEKIDRLKIEKGDIAEILRHHKNNYDLLKNEMESLNEKFLNTCHENDVLKKELNHLKNKTERLQNPRDDYQSTIIKQKSTINILEQKLKHSELREGKQIHLLNNAQSQINDLKATLAEKEKSVSECHHYKRQLLESNIKLEDYAKRNEQLNSQVQELQKQITGSSSCGNIVSDLHGFKEKMTKLLYNVVVHFVNEQESVLVICHSQEQKEHFRNVIEDIKRDNMILKDLVAVIQTGNCDFSNVSDILISCNSNLKKYYNLDRQFANIQVEKLQLSIKAYHQEIVDLKQLRQGSKENACPHCKHMVAELSQLSKVKTLHDEMLNILKDKNTVLGEENINRVKQIVDLQTKIYEEQDKKAEIQYTEWIKFYQENDKVQQQQIQKLQNQIGVYRSTPVNKSFAYVQCDLLQLDPSMQEKYDLMKVVCRRRNKEIAALKYEIENLKKCCSPLSGCYLDQSIQCDILDTEKYSAMKRLCMSRKQEIETLKTQLMTFKSAP